MFAELTAKIGTEYHVGEWLTVTQQMIDQFADVTRDQQWIHTDVARAQAESPFGATVAHGYLTLSLLSFLTGSVDPTVDRYPGRRLVVNYGLNRVRFPHPVVAGSRICARATLQSVEQTPDSLQVIQQVTIEIDGQPKPACVAETVARIYF